MRLAVVLLLAGVAACRGRADDAAAEIDLLARPGALRVTVAPGGGQPERTDLETVWDFENSASDGWTVRTYRGEVRGGRTVETAHSGKQSFCLESVSREADTDAQIHVKVRPGQRYQLDGYLFANQLAPGSARLYGTFYLGELAEWRDNAGDGEPIRWHVAMPKLSGTSAEWQHISYPFETTEQTHMLRIAASLGNWGAASGRICFDDVTLSEITAPPPAVPAAPNDAAPIIRYTDIGGELRRAIDASPPSEYRYRLTVPEGASLQLAFGVQNSRAARSGTELSVVATDGDREQALLSRRIDLAEGAVPQWWDAEIPLDALSGRSIELVFRTDKVRAGPGDRGAVAFWANPAIFVARTDADRQRAPDVFLITIDTLRADHLGCYGYERDTSPALDQLAKDAVLFEHTFTTIPSTTPALASLSTGLYPRAHGLIVHVYDRLSSTPRTLAEEMKASGYATVAIVTQNVSRKSGLHRGFDVYADHLSAPLEDPASRAEALATEATDWISAHLRQKMFLWLHVWDPHFRYDAPAPYQRLFDPDYPTPFGPYERLDRGDLTRGQMVFGNTLSAREVEHAIARYDGEIRYTDHVVGRFLDGLKERGLYDSALVVVTADHGESLGDHGCFSEHGSYLYDSTLRIPLLIKFPFQRMQGRRVKGNAGIVDVMPTILAAAGGSMPPHLAGVDLSPFAEETVDECVLTLRQAQGEREKLCSFKNSTARAELVEARGLHFSPFAEGGGEPHSVLYGETGRSFHAENPRRYLEGLGGNWKSARMGQWQLIQIPTAQGNQYELYDTAADPEEERNLYRSSQPVAEQLIVKLNEWLASFPDVSRPARIDAATTERLRALGYGD